MCNVWLLLNSFSIFVYVKQQQNENNTKSNIMTITNLLAAGILKKGLNSKGEQYYYTEDAQFFTKIINDNFKQVEFDYLEEGRNREKQYIESGDIVISYDAVTEMTRGCEWERTLDSTTDLGVQELYIHINGIEIEYDEVCEPIYAAVEALLAGEKVDIPEVFNDADQPYASNFIEL